MDNQPPARPAVPAPAPKPPTPNPVPAAPGTVSAPNTTGLSSDSSSPVLYPAPPANKSRREGLKSIASTLIILIVAPLIAFALTAFVFQSYQVDGPSMETTLDNSDRLIVLKLPRTWARITGHPYLPHRGDVIIFNKSDLPELGGVGKKQLVKRVIGLQGERVVVKNGTLTIYNSQNPNGFQPDKTLPYGNVIVTTPGDKEWTVGPNQIFVCGDNRPDSLDSRVFGPINLNDVVGKLAVKIFPFNKAKAF